MKGSAFVPMVSAIRSMTTAERFEGFLAALPNDVLTEVQRRIRADEWIPIIVPQTVRRVAYETLFDHDLGQVREMGRRAFLQHNRLIFRLAFRLLSRELMTTKLAVIWQASYRNHG